MHLSGLTLLALLGGSVGAARGETVDRIVAVVNDDVVTWTEVYDLGANVIEAAVQQVGGPGARRQAEIEVVDEMVNRRLIEQEMRRLGLDVTDADVERALADIARQNSLDRTQLQAEVERSGMAWETYLSELKQNIREIKFNQQVLGSRITVRDDEVTDFYRRNQELLAGPPRRQLQAVFLPLAAQESPDAAVKTLSELKIRISEGLSFEEASATRSAEPYAARRGEMGVFRRGELVGDLDKAAFQLQPGEVSNPVVTKQGVFLLKLTGTVASAAPPFEELKDQIQQRLMEEKVQEARETWVAQARRRSSVRVLLETPE